MSGMYGPTVSFIPEARWKDNALAGLLACFRLGARPSHLLSEFSDMAVA